MNFDDIALQIDCAGTSLVGVLSLPEQAASRGLLVLVGGPQYRAGSHRQFTLLARSLAEQGIAAMRFDYRGMGDSPGALRDFDTVADDLRCAIDAFMQRVPGLRDIVIWGLCDGASAALLHGTADRRVAGLVLLNPWVRTAEGFAKTTLKHYYVARVIEGAFWRKLFSGGVNLRTVVRGFGELMKASKGMPGAAANGVSNTANGAGATAAAMHAQGASGAPPSPGGAALPQRMLEGLQRFGGKVLLITSGRDLTAQEFLDLTAASAQWRRQLAAPRVSRQTVAGADHTFSRAEWRDQVAQLTANWVRSW